MNKLYTVSPNSILRVKVAKNDPYRAISKFWYYSPLTAGTAVSHIIVTDEYALVNRAGKVHLVIMKKNQADQIREVDKPPGNDFKRCSVIFIEDDFEQLLQ